MASRYGCPTPTIRPQRRWPVWWLRRACAPYPGLFRGTEGIVAAPTGPTLVLLAGTIAAFASTGLVGEQLITATLLTVAMGGVFQMLIGGLNLGHLIKFIPGTVLGLIAGTLAFHIL